MKILECFFWICAFLVFYTYIGYGILLWILLKLKRLVKGKAVDLPMPEDSELPEMTLMVCAYNEESIIDAKMENCRSLRYPQGKLHFVFVTDGSTDHTNERLQTYPEVTVVFKPERRGKTAALNHGIHHVMTPIIAFTDANTMLNQDAMLEIARLFQDGKVGCVSGEKRVCATSDGDTAGEGEGAYWRYESALKKMDSELCSAMGAAGELFAIRTELYREMAENTLLDDFMMSMLIVRDGYRIAYTDKAYAMETGSASMEEESKRKRRIAAGGLQSIWRLRGLLFDIRRPLVSFQFVSHRVLRWSITPVALLALVPFNVALVWMKAGWLYNLTWVLQIIFYLMVWLGASASREGKKNKFYIPYYFFFMNMNVFRGVSYLFSHRKSGAWEKAKRK